MEHTSIKVLTSKLKTFISIVFCFVAMLITKVLFGFVKTVEKLYDKLGIFDVLYFKIRKKN